MSAAIPVLLADALIETIDRPKVGGDLNVFERLVYRYVVFPRVKNAFLDLGTQLDFVKRQEDWGPGRVDTFNPYKALQFNFPMTRPYIRCCAERLFRLSRHLAPAPA